MRSTRYRLRVALAALAAIVICGASRADEDDPIVRRDVVYAKAGDVELKLDIARPNGDGPFPALVFIHGGGWRGGNRQSFSPFVFAAVGHGYVAATVSYRLTDPDENGKPKNPFPAAIHDVKCAIRWMRAHADEWHIDPNRIGAAGGSAGGHLALLAGFTDRESELEGDLGYAEQSSRVQAIANFCGPTDLLSAYDTTVGGRPLVDVFMDGKPTEKPENYKRASPITWVTDDDPPVLTFHGGKDTLVPTTQAHELDAALKKAGVPHTLVVYEDQGHGFRADLMVVSIDRMFKFFDQHLKPPVEAK